MLNCHDIQSKRSSVLVLFHSRYGHTVSSLQWSSHWCQKRCTSVYSAKRFSQKAQWKLFYLEGQSIVNFSGLYRNVTPAGTFYWLWQVHHNHCCDRKNLFCLVNLVSRLECRSEKVMVLSEKEITQCSFYRTFPRCRGHFFMHWERRCFLSMPCQS